MIKEVDKERSITIGKIAVLLAVCPTLSADVTGRLQLSRCPGSDLQNKN